MSAGLQITGWPAHDSAISSVLFGPDETSIFSLGSDGKVSALILAWSLVMSFSTFHFILFIDWYSMFHQNFNCLVNFKPFIFYFSAKKMIFLSKKLNQKFVFRYLNGACKVKVKFFGQEIAAGTWVACPFDLPLLFYWLSGLDGIRVGVPTGNSTG